MEMGSSGSSTSTSAWQQPPLRAPRSPTLPLQPSPGIRRPSFRPSKAAGAVAGTGATGSRSANDGPPWPLQPLDQLSPHVGAAHLDILALLQRPPRSTVALASGAMSPKVLLEACSRWRLTLVDLEYVAMSCWTFTHYFPDRATFFDYIDPSPEFAVGEQVRFWRTKKEIWQTAEVLRKRSVWRRDRLFKQLQMYVEYDLDAEEGVEPARIKRAWPRPSSRPVTSRHGLRSTNRFLDEICQIDFVGPQGFMCHSARWVELLDGRVLARMMSDPSPTHFGNFDQPAFGAAVLAGLRMVQWTLETHWVFPSRCQARLYFIAWVGKLLGLNGVWTNLVIPFLGCDLSWHGRCPPSL
mmetsp:Transcript_103351/g.322066  ORF Transcript_103351/g.322066 Transcript_103351/m.322066 type:complete len:353 (+) Transcript_103351:95-1153(+)